MSGSKLVEVSNMNFPNSKRTTKFNTKTKQSTISASQISWAVGVSNINPLNSKRKTKLNTHTHQKKKNENFAKTAVRKIKNNKVEHNTRKDQIFTKTKVRKIKKVRLEQYRDLKPYNHRAKLKSVNQRIYDTILLVRGVKGL